MLPGPSATVFNADNQDLVLFTPDRPGDYTSGTFEMLLDSKILKPDMSPGNIHAVSIVEKQVTIGVDTVLEAGTFLVARSDGGTHANVLTYRGVSDGEMPQTLLVGSDTDFGLGSVQIQGLELLEDDTTLGTATLPSGTLLMTVDTGVTLVGGVEMDDQDIVALTINGTELDSSGDTDVTAAIFFDASDVAMGAGSEKINALTVANSVTAVITPTANDDAFDVSEDTTFNAILPGVLANDSHGEDLLTPGASLQFDADQDLDGDNLWQTTTALGLDWNLSGAVTRLTAPTTGLPAIDTAYAFDGSGGATMPAFASIAGDPTDDSASFELWFNPSDASGQELLFETGSTGTGISFVLNDNVLEMTVFDGGATAFATADIGTADRRRRVYSDRRCHRLERCGGRALVRQRRTR